MGTGTLLKEGQAIGNKYEVERFLGDGAFGEVWRVRHKYLGRQAMKVFKTVGLTSAEVENVLTEALLLSQLKHPNIIQVYDADTLEAPVGVHGFFTMEYVPGGSLDDFWRSHGRQFMPVETSVQISLQICRGVNAAHSQRPPIVHRDIKPQNILVGYDADGLRIRVSDFGLAKRANPLTLRLTAMGTPLFKSPEVIGGSDPRSDSAAGDVWAIGVTLYLMLTDRFPYSGDEARWNDIRRFSEPLKRAGGFNSRVDADLERILGRALAVDPERRYPTAKHLLSELEAWNAPSPSAPAPSRPQAGPGKSALGEHSAVDEEKARGLAESALELASGAERLAEAADMMEQAMNAWPPLREKYEYRLKLWRRGVIN